MRLTSSRAYNRPTPVPQMPHGLVELMDGMAREVLLNNPTNIYEFCTNHMEKLLEIRDGPSSKKPLTLEQKILKAQEKVRQRAKERQERFDEEIKLQSNKSNERPSSDKIDTSIIQDDSIIPNLRPIVHQVQDLEHSSEIEISHDLHAEKDPVALSETSEASKFEELNVGNEKANVVKNEYLMEPEKIQVAILPVKEPYAKQIVEKANVASVSGNVETISEKRTDEPISGNMKAMPDKRSDDELTSRTMEAMPDKRSDEHISGIMETINDTKSEVEPGNVEIVPAERPSNEPISVNIVTIFNKRADKEPISENIETMPGKTTDDEPISGNVKAMPDRNPDVESGNVETMPGKIPDEPISVNIVTKPDKPEDEPISGNVETIPDKRSEEPISGNAETTIGKNPYDEIFFGKVEKELKVESSKHVETIEIIGLEDDVERQLQTITEVPLENAVSEGNITSTAILPKITIGDVHGEDEPNVKAENPVLEKHLEVQHELKKENSGIINPVQDTENQNMPLNLLEKSALNTNTVVHKATENESNPSKTKVPNLENTVNDIEKDISDRKSFQQADNEKRCNSGEIVAISEMTIEPISSSVVEKDLDKNVQQIKNNDDNSNVSTDTIHNDDTPNLIANVPDIHDVSSNMDQSIDNTTNENINLATISNKMSTEIENETETECTIKNETIGQAKTEDEIVNRIDIQKDEIETDNIPNEEETNKANMNNDYEQFQNNSTDVLLQKSDSTENINEDSLSSVKSDLSKTDEDSSQNNPNMDLETAAVTIQKVFRSFMFKSRNSTFEDITNEEHNSLDEENDKKEEYYAAAANLNKERRSLGITRMDSVLQTVNEEKSLSLSTDDSSTLSSAATTIQAHVRGFLVRNKLNSSKTVSMNSLVNSHEVLDTDSEQQKNKTILNIHIVPEDRNYLSRDESLITSMELSMDGSPPSSINLHPLSCDISERRKMLKREDAVQSVSPPSNNSGKLSEDSVKELLMNENGVLEKEPSDDKTTEIEDQPNDVENETSDVMSSASTVTPTTIITISKSEEIIKSPRENAGTALQHNGKSLTKMSSDESDVITPFVPSPRNSVEVTKLVHSGEFHDVLLPTKVSRNDTSVVRGE